MQLHPSRQFASDRFRSPLKCHLQRRDNVLVWKSNVCTVEVGIEVCIQNMMEGPGSHQQSMITYRTTTYFESVSPLHWKRSANLQLLRLVTTAYKKMATCYSFDIQQVLQGLDLLVIGATALSRLLRRPVPLHTSFIHAHSGRRCTWSAKSSHLCQGAVSCEFLCYCVYSTK